MHSIEVHMANLDDGQLNRVKQLEQRLGTIVVAVDKPPEFADLTPQQLDELKKTEAELGRVLLAYKGH